MTNEEVLKAIEKLVAPRRDNTVRPTSNLQRSLEARIAKLERRVAELEARPTIYPYYPLNPMGPTITYTGKFT